MSDKAGHAISMARRKLDERVMYIAKQTIATSLKNCAWDHNKVLVRQTIRSALQNLLASTFVGDTAICNAFEVTIAQVVRLCSLAKKLASDPVSDPAILALILTYVVKKADDAIS